MKKIKKLLAVFAAVGVALMLPLQTMAAVDLNAKYDISTNQIQGWPAGPDITSDTGILMDADTGVVLYNKGGDESKDRRDSLSEEHESDLLSGQHYQDHDLAGGSGELHHG